MFLPRAQREELNALSKEVFGVSSKWQKFLDKGTTELKTRKTIEIVPGVDGAPDTEKEVVIPDLAPNGTKQFYQKYYTLDQVRQLMVDSKTQMDNYRAAMKKQQDEKVAQEEINALAQGSAI